MAKRSKFKRRARDFYPTPPEAVQPLLAHLPAGTRFAEPCAGKGDLIDHLRAAGHECAFAVDKLPLRGDIEWMDALDFEALSMRRFHSVDCIITNPPWDRPILHPMINNFASLKPTWLLFDSNWANTKQAAGFANWCKMIVPIGRVSWMGNKVSGTKDCAWYLFDKTSNTPTEFLWRAA